jgi:outer membrane protein assembly factor BamB
MKLPALLVIWGMSTTIVWSADKSLEWPRFRGPNGSGVADSAKPPVEFGPDKNLKWKVSAPNGLSSPIIAKDKVVITAFEDGKLYTVAYHIRDGAEAWRADAHAKKLEPFHKTEGSPAASTPATDGKRIVSYFGSCGLLCYDASGKEFWKFEMPPVGSGGEFGSGVSPIIADGLVILVRDERNNSKIIALDVTTGSLKWERKRLSTTSYCTPIVLSTPAGKQIAAAGHAQMIGYDLKTGAEAWFYNGMPAGCITSPVFAGGALFFAGGGGGGADDKPMQMPDYDSMLKNLDKNNDGVISRDEGEKAFEGFFDNLDADHDGKLTRDEWEKMLKFVAEGKDSVFALKPGGKGDITTSNLLWKKAKGLPYITSALLYRDQYIMVKDGGIVTAYDAKTGDQVYQERAVAAGKYYASPVAANDHIYFTTLADGVVTVVKAGGQKPEVVATNPKLGERTAATPAIAGDVLYIRTDKHLYAFAPKK